MNPSIIHLTPTFVAAAATTTKNHDMNTRILVSIIGLGALFTGVTGSAIAKPVSFTDLPQDAKVAIALAVRGGDLGEIEEVEYDDQMVYETTIRHAGVRQKLWVKQDGTVLAAAPGKGNGKPPGGAQAGVNGAGLQAGAQAPGAGAQGGGKGAGAQAGQKNNGQQGQKNDGQAGQKDDGQAGQKDDGQQGQKDDGQQGQKNDGQAGQKNGGQQGQKIAGTKAANGNVQQARKTIAKQGQ